MKKTITVLLPNDFTFTAKQVKQLNKSFRENWGVGPDYTLTNFDIVSEAMRTNVISEEEGYGVVNDDGSHAF